MPHVTNKFILISSTEQKSIIRDGRKNISRTLKFPKKRRTETWHSINLGQAYLSIVSGISTELDAERGSAKASRPERCRSEKAEDVLQLPAPSCRALPWGP